MRIYIIGNDRITLSCEAPATMAEGEIAVASKEELHAAPLSGKRLLSLWNALPGIEADRLTGRVLPTAATLGEQPKEHARRQTERIGKRHRDQSPRDLLFVRLGNRCRRDHASLGHTQEGPVAAGAGSLRVAIRTQALGATAGSRQALRCAGEAAPVPNASCRKNKCWGFT